MSARILVVDDEKEIADLLELYLVNEGFTVQKCYTAAAALRYLEGEKPDLAILDIMLPEVNGFEICRRIRETDFYPIIMLTAKDAQIDKITGLTIGADDYVTKPFLPLELVARVRAQLRRYQRYGAPGKEGAPGKTGESGLLVMKDLRLDTEGHQCFRGDTEIFLTPTEFTILKVLLLNGGKVVSAEELFHAVWADDYYSRGNNTVSVHIRHIREKLKDTAENPKYIKTVWGVGYRADV